MLIATTHDSRDGRKLLILGLDAENIRRLQNDEPIYKNLADAGIGGLEEWDLTILGPEDLHRFIARVGVQPREA